MSDECCESTLDEIVSTDPAQRACDYVFGAIHAAEADPLKRWQLIGDVKKSLPGVLEEARALVIAQLSNGGLPMAEIAAKLGVSRQRVYELQAFPGREEWDASQATDAPYLLGSAYGVLNALVGHEGALMRYRNTWERLLPAHVSPRIALVRLAGSVRKWTGGDEAAIDRIEHLISGIDELPDRFGLGWRERFYMGYYHESARRDSRRRAESLT